MEDAMAGEHFIELESLNNAMEHFIDYGIG
jgi:hypothetical protein